MNKAIQLIRHLNNSKQWRHAREAGRKGGNFPTLPLNFSLSENALLVENFSSKSTKFGINIPPFRGI